MGKVEPVGKAAVRQPVFQPQHGRYLDLNALLLRRVEFAARPYAAVSLVVERVFRSRRRKIIIFVFGIHFVIKIQSILFSRHFVERIPKISFVRIGGAVVIARIAAAQFEQSQKGILIDVAELSEQKVGQIVVIADHEHRLILLRGEIPALVHDIVLRKDVFGIAAVIRVEIGSAGHHADDVSQIVDQIRELGILFFLFGKHIDKILLQRG